MRAAFVGMGLALFAAGGFAARAASSEPTSGSEGVTAVLLLVATALFIIACVLTVTGVVNPGGDLA
jgi:hypothetical protein